MWHPRAFVLLCFRDFVLSRDWFVMRQFCHPTTPRTHEFTKARSLRGAHSSARRSTRTRPSFFSEPLRRGGRHCEGGKHLLHFPVPAIRTLYRFRIAPQNFFKLLFTLGAAIFPNRHSYLLYCQERGSERENPIFRESRRSDLEFFVFGPKNEKLKV